MKEALTTPCSDTVINLSLVKLRIVTLFLVYSLWLLFVTLLADSPQSIKRQNKGPREHDENLALDSRQGAGYEIV